MPKKNEHLLHKRQTAIKNRYRELKKIPMKREIIFDTLVEEFFLSPSQLYRILENEKDFKESFVNSD